MKKIKYIIALFSVIFCVGIIGEVYQNYLYLADDEFVETTFYLQPNGKEEDMLSDIHRTAEKYNLDVFMMLRETKSSYQAKINIFADSETSAVLKEEYMLKSGCFKSLFSGETEIVVSDFFDFLQFEGDKTNSFYLIGNEEDMNAFKMDLVEDYAGAFPKAGEMNNRKNMRQMIFTVWMIATVLVLFLTFYDSKMQMKENMLRITLGERIGKIIAENIVMDTVFLVFTYGILRFVFCRLTNVSIYPLQMCIMLILLIVLNSFLYLGMYRTDLKLAFSNVKVSNKVLSLNYVIKAVTTVAVVLILTVNFAVIYEAYRYYQQRDFYEQYKDYNYVQIGTGEDDDILAEDGEMEERAMQLFYQECYKDADIFALTTDIVISQNERPVISANYNTWDYLVERISELSGIEHENRNLLIIPEGYKLSEENEEFLAGFFNDYENYKKITYKKKASLVTQTFDALQGSVWCETPVIWYDGKKEFSKTEIEEGSYEIPFSFTLLLIKKDKEQIKEFLMEKDIPLHFIITNVYDHFRYQWLILKRAMILNIVLSVLFIILELLSDITIVKLEYQVYAIELSLKKIMGYTLMERNKRMLQMTVGANLCSLLTVVIVCKMNHFGNLVFVVVGDIILLLLQVAVILFYSLKQEKADIHTILKGGCL